MLLPSGADARRVVTVVVSTFVAQVKTHLIVHTALYEADKQAHEEAVTNGGVSCHILSWSSTLTRISFL